ncbi:MAG: serine hydrolase [Saprospiraceae bacterium]|nr:serine hydrolase [Saprospiraceae bacterium]
MKIILTAVVLIKCSLAFAQTPYFPPVSNDDWERVDPVSLAWSTDRLDELKTYVADHKTKAFLILHKGKIVVEWYFDDHDKEKPWYWASAGKTLTSSLVGIAENQGLLSFEDSSSKYLGKGWTSCDASSEGLIKIKHQLSMTSGLNDAQNSDCTEPACLECLATPGERWAYHNSPYTLLDGVIEGASGDNLTTFFRKNIGQKIGMNGLYVKSGYNNVFYSTALSMARFGLLLINDGQWSGNNVIPADYVKAMHNSSQNINPSYGLLTWLNGKDKFMLPSSQIKFAGPLIESAPSDMYAALGKNDQKLHIVPSLDLVLVRMGDAAEDGGKNVPIQFDEGIWRILGPAINHTTNVDNHNLGDGLSVNQSNGILTVSLPEQTVKQIVLYNLNGQIVSLASKNEVQISDLKTGFYILNATTESGVVVTKKVIVAN